MGVVMRLALTWVGLGLLANTAVATLSQEAISELQDELNQVGGQDMGLFVDPAEDELMNLLADNGDNEVPDDESQEPYGYPEPRYAGDSSEVIESIDEIDSITPIKSIQEVKSIKPIKSIEEIKSITPIKSIQEVKSIKKVKSILPVPDDIAQKFIADHGLVPTDDDGYNTAPQYGGGGGNNEDSPVDTVQEGAQSSLRAGLEDVIGILNSLVQSLEDQDLCREEEYEPDPGPSWSYEHSKESNLPFDIDDIESIDKIKSMKEITSMLPVKKITEVKSITPIKSIQEVTGLYELTDEQADQLRRLNAKWSRKSDHRRRGRRRF